MTLVLSCVARDLVVSVADRRVTWISGPLAGTTATDKQNKAVVICDLLAFAYTGLAQVGNLPTDRWLLELAARVVPFDPQAVCETIASEATTQFRTISGVDKRHAFLGVGWATFASHGDLCPYAVAISNALDPSGKWKSKPTPTFAITVLPLSVKRAFAIASVGQPLRADDVQAMRRTLKEATRRKIAPVEYVRTLANAIWRVADRNSAVGRNLNAVYLPRPREGAPTGLTIPLGVRTPSDGATALYLPSDGADPVIYAPNYTCGGSSYADMWIKPGAEFSIDDRWWEHKTLILSKRLGSFTNDDPIRPQIADEFLSRGWGIFAEFRRYPDGKPSPCIIRTVPTQELDAWLSSQPAYIVVFDPRRDPDDEPDEAWVRMVKEWLLNAEVGPELLDPFFEEFRPASFRVAAEQLREFFHRRYDHEPPSR